MEIFFDKISKQRQKLIQKTQSLLCNLKGIFHILPWSKLAIACLVSIFLIASYGPIWEVHAQAQAEGTMKYLQCILRNRPNAQNFHELVKNAKTDDDKRCLKTEFANDVAQKGNNLNNMLGFIYGRDYEYGLIKYTQALASDTTSGDELQEKAMENMEADSQYDLKLNKKPDKNSSLRYFYEYYMTSSGIAGAYENTRINNLQNAKEAKDILRQILQTNESVLKDFVFSYTIRKNESSNTWQALNKLISLNNATNAADIIYEISEGLSDTNGARGEDQYLTDIGKLYKQGNNQAKATAHAAARIVVDFATIVSMMYVKNTGEYSKYITKTNKAAQFMKRDYFSLMRENFMDHKPGLISFFNTEGENPRTQSDYNCQGNKICFKYYNNQTKGTATYADFYTNIYGTSEVVKPEVVRINKGGDYYFNILKSARGFFEYVSEKNNQAKTFQQKKDLQLWIPDTTASSIGYGYKLSRFNGIQDGKGNKNIGKRWPFYVYKVEDTDEYAFDTMEAWKFNYIYLTGKSTDQSVIWADPTKTKKEVIKGCSEGKYYEITAEYSDDMWNVSNMKHVNSNPVFCANTSTLDNARVSAFMITKYQEGNFSYYYSGYWDVGWTGNSWSNFWSNISGSHAAKYGSFNPEKNLIGYLIVLKTVETLDATLRGLFGYAVTDFVALAGTGWSNHDPTEGMNFEDLKQRYSPNNWDYTISILHSVICYNTFVVGMALQASGNCETISEKKQKEFLAAAASRLNSAASKVKSEFQTFQTAFQSFTLNDAKDAGKMEAMSQNLMQNLAKFPYIAASVNNFLSYVLDVASSMNQFKGWMLAINTIILVVMTAATFGAFSGIAALSWLGKMPTAFTLLKGSKALFVAGWKGVKAPIAFTKDILARRAAIKAIKNKSSDRLNDAATAYYKQFENMRNPRWFTGLTKTPEELEEIAKMRTLLGTFGVTNPPNIVTPTVAYKEIQKIMKEIAEGKPESATKLKNLIDNNEQIGTFFSQISKRQGENLLQSFKAKLTNEINTVKEIAKTKKLGNKTPEQIKEIDSLLAELNGPVDKIKIDSLKQLTAKADDIIKLIAAVQNAEKGLSGTLGMWKKFWNPVKASFNGEKIYRVLGLGSRFAFLVAAYRNFLDKQCDTFITEDTRTEEDKKIFEQQKDFFDSNGATGKALEDIYGDTWPSWVNGINTNLAWAKNIETQYIPDAYSHFYLLRVASYSDEAALDAETFRVIKNNVMISLNKINQAFNFQINNPCIKSGSTVDVPKMKPIRHINKINISGITYFGGGEDPENNASITGVLKRGMRLIFLFIASVSMIGVLYGGFLYTQNYGQDDTIEKARDTILYSLMGLVITFLAYLVVAVVEGFMRSL